MNIGGWLRDRPNLLSRAYQITHWLVYRFDPIISWIGYERADRWIRTPEKIAKIFVFDCRMCGQCVLHSTGMTCSMTCPKTLRNGPCGGVCQNGNCEVFPDMRCVWMEAFERSKEMKIFGEEIKLLQPPVNGQLADSSAWINMLTGKDKIVPKGWEVS